MGIEKKRKKTVLILGADGYIGWPLFQKLQYEYECYLYDNFSRRNLAQSLIERTKFSSMWDDNIRKLKVIPQADAIIHLAEQPSAPWSMDDKFRALDTQQDNVLGTLNLLWLMREYCPNAHLIKLGSMGEYGTPDCIIPEGFIEENCPTYHPIDDLAKEFGKIRRIDLSCPYAKLMFPRTPNSFYHLSKVFDSMNIDFACRTWGLRSTDIMQGIVFGIGGRFDYDEHFGTVINRFCTQVVAGIPLTVYGTGGQKRAFLPLKDSIECLTRVLENPPEKGEYRVFNQFARTYSIVELAETVQKVGNELGLDVRIQHLNNPRKEAEKHYFQPKHDKLRKLGYEPNWNLEDELREIIETILPYKDKINKDVILPKTKWS